MLNTQTIYATEYQRMAATCYKRIEWLRNKMSTSGLPAMYLGSYRDEIVVYQRMAAKYAQRAMDVMNVAR